MAAHLEGVTFSTHPPLKSNQLPTPPPGGTAARAHAAADHGDLRHHRHRRRRHRLVTIGGILGMAAHLEGKGVGVLDMAGLAQKGGAVYSHMRIAERPEDIHAIRDRGRQRRPGAGRRHRRRRQQESAGRGQARHDRDGDQYSPSSCPAISPATPISRCRPSGSSAPFSKPPAREKTHFIDASRAASRAVRQHRRRQHLPGRLRLSARRAAAGGGVDRAGDRAQRRSGGDEQGGVPLGPPRRARSRRGRGADQAGARGGAAMRAGCRSRSTRRSSAASRS